MKRINLLCMLCLLILSASYDGYAATSASDRPTSDDCLACHGDASLVNGKVVHGDAYAASMHGSIFSCVDCHTDIESLPHGSPLAKPVCSTCHTEETKNYALGDHAKAVASGMQRSATCESCHGDVHEIRPSTELESPTARLNIPRTCGKCHAEPIPGMAGKPAIAYQESVHGRLLAAGNEGAAVCTDCHSPHNNRGPSDPTSRVYHSNIPKTCARCHTKEAAIFDESVHGEVMAAGNIHAPVCTDCHGVHTIQAVEAAGSPVSPQNQAEVACAQCHNSVRMTEEFGIPGRRTATYRYSYHGMASAIGSKKVAICSSCHGTHDILPASDPRSTINPKNLVRTCGQCHPGANANFAKGKIHLDPAAAAQADFGSKVVSWVRKFYIALIVCVIGFMLAHNLVIFGRKLIERKKYHPGHRDGARIVVRMTRNQRIQHFVLFISFFILVLTGFSLKFPGSFLHVLFVNETGRSIIHRIAGVTMVLDGLYHLLYVAFSADGRKMLRDMLPEWKDLTDVGAVFSYYLGFSPRKPLFKRFSYAEKIEYWALVWGTFIMALTGFMMWFKVTTADMLPRWWIDVATTIHFYEAILATLAILVWHFYQVIFDPDTYPVNYTFLDGKMSVEQYKEEHALDSETLSQYLGGGEGGAQNNNH